MMQSRVERLLCSLRQFVPHGTFGKAVAVVASGTAISQLIGLAVIPITTRLFPPDAFGVLAVYMASLTLIQSFVGLRYEMAIPVEETERGAFLMLIVSLAAVVFVSIATLVFSFVLSVGAIEFDQIKALATLVWLLPLGVVLAGTYQALRYWAIRDRAYRDIAATTMSQGIGRGVIQLVAGVAHAGALGLIIGEIVGQAAGITRLGRSAMTRVRSHWHSLSLSELKAAARNNSSFPLLMAPASLLNGAGAQVPTLLLAAFYGPTVAGWYYVTQRLLGVPVTLIGTAMGQVFLGEAAPLARSNPEKLSRMFNALSRRLLLLGAIPVAALILLAPWGVEFALGSKWGEAGIYLQWLSIGFLLKLSFDGLINLSIVRRNDLALLWAVLRLAMACGAVLAAHFMRLPATTCIAMLGVAFAAGYLLKLWFWQRALRKLHVMQP